MSTFEDIQKKPEQSPSLSEQDLVSYDTQYVDEWLPRYEPAVGNLELSPDARIDPAQVSVSGLGKYVKYLNPIEGAKRYGTFVKETVKEFGIPELVGTGAMYGALLGAKFMEHRFGVSMGSWTNAIASYTGETAGFYGANFAQEYFKLRRDKEREYSRYHAAKEAGRYTLGLLSIAEAVDAPTRPIMIHAMEGTGMGPEAAATAGKVISDHIYGMVGVPLSKRLRKKAKERYDAGLVNATGSDTDSYTPETRERIPKHRKPDEVVSQATFDIA